MIERVHQHLLSELERATKADTVFVVCAVLFNILALFIGWAQAVNLNDPHGNWAIYALVTAASLMVTAAALLSLHNSRKSCVALHAALLLIYQDTNVLKYFPPDAEETGNTRLVLSLIVVAGTGILAIAIPLMEYLW